MYCNLITYDISNAIQIILKMAMQIINQIGHLQHWGLTPATNFLSHFAQKQPASPMKVLLTGTCDIRHILKTLADIDIAQSPQPKKIEIYFHEIHKELLCRVLLFLHIIHETQLNFEERVQLFLDLYGNSLIKERNSRYVSNLRLDLLNLIHGQKKVSTPIKQFVKLNLLKFEQRDQMSEIMQAWSNKIEYDIVKLRDQRLRFMFKERYDYRANLVDWDYGMLLSEYAPIMHFYHYKEWRLTGLAFQQRFSTYTEPNRTLASYVPGRKKQEKTSCMVRGYWGDMIISPYIAMGIETNSGQKELLFKKANMKYIGHTVELTQYNLTYWLQRIETETTYEKYFRDYYRTDEQGKKKLEEKEELKKKKKKAQMDAKKQLGDIKEEDEEHAEKETQIQQKQEKQEKKEKQEKSQLEAKKVDNPFNSKQQDEQLDSQQQQRRANIRKKNAQDIKPITVQQTKSPKLKLFQKYGVEVYPMAMPGDNLMKPKYKQFFDVIVCGFTHSAYLSKDRYLQGSLKKGGQLYVETARYIVPKKKQQRKQLQEKLKAMVNEKPAKQDQQASTFKLEQDGDNYIIYTKTA